MVFVVTLGDQRRITVVLSSPSNGDSVPATIRQLSVTFSTEPDRSSVESRLNLDPPVPGTIRWRGATMVYTFSSPLSAGQHRVSISEGASGRASEPLDRAFTATFIVRQPGIIMVQQDDQKQRLVSLRDGKTDTMLSADRIVDFATSPDGTFVAVVSENVGQTTLSLISPVSREIRPLVHSPGVSLGGVTWATDASALLVVRRDRLPSGVEGVPRTWLTRLTGEFVGPIDPSGSPSINPRWSPDAQSVAYMSPAEGKLSIENLTSHEVTDLGQPRGGAPAWSPDSTRVAFESVPPTNYDGSGLLQPIRVRSLDGTVDRFLGTVGEARWAPAFLDNDTLMDLRWTPANPSRGTELLFESVKTGQLLRSVQLTSGSDSVVDWDLDPLRKHVVYTVRLGASLKTIDLDLESGTRTELIASGLDPRWLP
jgi:dipeptidyl aminopeptidase/acylaminoacyl peptidase